MKVVDFKITKEAPGKSERIFFGEVAVREWWPFPRRRTIQIFREGWDTDWYSLQTGVPMLNLDLYWHEKAWRARQQLEQHTKENP
jgi:hypothetical protein